MIQKIKNGVGRAFSDIDSFYRIQKFYSHNYLDTSRNIIITGSPRSGTTWLAETLQEVNGAFMLFEPLSLKCKKFEKIGFDWRQHIPENEVWKEAVELFNMLYSGKYLNSWMLSHSDKRKLSQTHFFIFKFVRANLLLPWLIRTLQPNRKPVFIIRNPLSVIKSQMENNWISFSNGFPIPRSRFATEYYGQFEEILNGIKSPSEFLTARWCLDNYYLLNHPKNNVDWIMVRYEELLKNPETELKSLYFKLNIDFHPSVLEKLERKSKSDYKKSIEKESVLNFNQKECIRVIEAFKLSDYIVED